MIVAFQVVMIVGFIISLLGAIGEKENEKLREQMTTVCIATVFGFLIVTFVL